jgi:hypothetical protein
MEDTTPVGKKTISGKRSRYQTYVFDSGFDADETTNKKWRDVLGPERLALGLYPSGEIDYGLVLVGFRHTWFKKRFRKLSEIKAENAAKRAEFGCGKQS